MAPPTPFHVDVILQDPSHSIVAQTLSSHPHGVQILHYESSIHASFNLDLVMKILDLLNYGTMVEIHVLSSNYLLLNYPNIDPSSTL